MGLEGKGADWQGSRGVAVVAKTRGLSEAKERNGTERKAKGRKGTEGIVFFTHIVWSGECTRRSKLRFVV